MAKVSVLVPIYRVEKYIDRCARSLFEQTFDDIEFIFINDCTPDRSIDILMNVIEDYPSRKNSVSIINHDVNHGLVFARRTALLHSSGEYVLNVDSDDWIEPVMVERMYNAACEKKAAIVSCEILLEEKTGGIPLCYPESVMNEAPDLSKISLSEHSVLFACLCNKLIKRELLLHNGIILNNHISQYEDLAITFFLRFRERNFVRIHGLFYHYNRDNMTSLTYNITDKKLSERIKVINICQNFVQKNASLRDFSHTLLLLKFLSKSDLLVEPSLFNPRKWRDIFPESNKLCFSYPNINKSARMIGILLYFHLDLFAEICNGLRTMIYKK